jgi:hypothetical protein
MLRKIALSLLMMFSVVVILPFADSAAHGLRQSSTVQQRRLRRHSRAWWRRYRARLRVKRAFAAAALAHRKVQLEPLISESNEGMIKGVLPALPLGWSAASVAHNGELRLKKDKNAEVPSQATLSVVARSRPTPTFLSQREQARLLAGVAFSDLRRIVIDKMINAGGWVINDYERQVNGARVFVVIAQTPGDERAPEKSWQFYFAEVEGKIYSVTLNAPLQFSDRLAGEGERFLNSLQLKNPTPVAPKQ